MKYKFWQLPFFAFFSTRAYRYVGQELRGFGFLYLLILVAITALVPIISLTTLTKYLFVDRGDQIAEQIPIMTFQKGKLSLDRPTPCFVIDPQSGFCLMAFDTNGQLASHSNEFNCILTQDAISVRGMKRSFEGIDNFKLDSRDFKRILAIGAYLLPLFFYVLLVPTNWLLCICIVLGFSVPGLILSRALSVSLKYEGIVRIASLALGNILLIGALLQLAQIILPSEVLYKFVIAFAYTMFGIGANLSPPAFQPVKELSATESTDLQR